MSHGAELLLITLNNVFTELKYGDFFTEPKNLSQDQEISFDPLLSANGTLLSVA